MSSTVVSGTNANNVIDLSQTPNNYTVYGMGGADTITVSDGNNTIYGGSGPNDTTDGSDFISVLGSGNNLIYGNSGNDIIHLGKGSLAGQTDTVYGGSGNDVVSAGPGGGSLCIYGQAGSDTIDLSRFANAATVYGGSPTDSVDSADTITLGIGNSLVYGNGGDDRITLATGLGHLATVYGGQGNDTITASGAGKLAVYGGVGADYIDLSQNTLPYDSSTFPNLPYNTIFGGSGFDSHGQWIFDADNDTLIGSAGRDLIYSTGGHDVLFGNGENDSMLAFGVHVTMYGGSGDDGISLNRMPGALPGNNTPSVLIAGGVGNDGIWLFNALDFFAHPDGFTIAGGQGNDILTLEDSATTVTGSNGIDDSAFAHISGIEELDIGSGGQLFQGGTHVTLGGAAQAAGITRVWMHTYSGLDPSSLTADYALNVEAQGSNQVRVVLNAGGTVHGGTYQDTFTGSAGHVDNYSLTWEDGWGNGSANFVPVAHDVITNFGLGTGGTAVDQFSFDLTFFFGDAWIGNANSMVDGLTRINSITDAGNPFAEVIILQTVGVATANIDSALDTINASVFNNSNSATRTGGVLDLLFDTTLGHAVLYFDCNANLPGGHVWLAEMTNITNIADMANFTAANFDFSIYG